MNYYPVFLDLRNQHCLVVGGGAVATRKIKLLRRAGAQLTVLSPAIDAELARCLQDDQALTHRCCSLHQLDLSQFRLIIAATDDGAVNRQVATAAKAANILVNVVDQPELCTFISPAIVDRNPLLIAISSAGAAPVLARQLRQRLEQWLPERLGSLAQWAGNLRQKVKERLPFSQRRIFWERVFFGPIAQHWLAGRQQAAEKLFKETLDQNSQPQTRGEVYIVGAGPGNPDLLTLRALQLMQQADVVLHDRLVSDAVLERARRDAERIFVGKQSGCHHKTQDQINQLMVDLAQQGKRVCRLKGGDPFIFGRGGEEAEFLVQHKIAFQVVPGITSAAGCAAYAGIPLTHRKSAHGVQLITGHVRGDRTTEEWKSLAQSQQTLVFYMALERVADVASSLAQAGACASTPAAVIERGTLPEQRVIIGNLSDIAKRCHELKVESPALLLVGETCTLHAKLNWFESSKHTNMEIGPELAVA